MSEFPTTSSSSSSPAPSPEQVQSGLQNIESALQDVQVRFSTLESDRREHELVLAALIDLPPERRCARMVGGIMAERCVSEIRPQIEQNMEKLLKEMEKCGKELKEKQELKRKFREKYGVKSGSNGSNENDFECGDITNQSEIVNQGLLC